MAGFRKRLFTRTAAGSRRAAIKLIPKACAQNGNLYLLVYFSSAVCPSDLSNRVRREQHDKDTQLLARLFSCFSLRGSVLVSLCVCVCACRVCARAGAIWLTVSNELT